MALLSGQRAAAPYAALSLALALGNVAGAVALARHLDSGRRLLALGALGFFPQAAWGLAAAYASGWLGWGLSMGTAPVEAWMIWFLLQPEVRAHLRVARARADDHRI
jgi:hypothetical protein